MGGCASLVGAALIAVAAVALYRWSSDPDRCHNVAARIEQAARWGRWPSIRREFTEHVMSCERDGDFANAMRFAERQGFKP